MAYTNSDILNIYTGHTYGIAASETKIQGMNSDDKARLAKLVEENWSFNKTTDSAESILEIVNFDVPFSASLLREVKAFLNSSSNNESSKVYSTVDSTHVNSSPLSTTSNDSKSATATATRSDNSGDADFDSDNPIIVTGTRNTSNNPLTIARAQPSVESSIIPQPKHDRRVRLSPKAAVFDEMITKTGIMAPLRETYGFMFPTSPTISETIETNYETYDMIHGLMPLQAFKSGGAKVLTVSGTLYAQTDVEARYVAACIHFVRTFSKMNFGDSDPNAGTPPPILMFNAYGDVAFRNVPVILNQASVDWPNDVDYIYTSAVDSEIASAAYKANSAASAYSTRSIDRVVADGWVPSKITISLTLTVQPTPSSLRAFNLEDFRNGSLMGGTRGWI